MRFCYLSEISIIIHNRESKKIKYHKNLLYKNLIYFNLLFLIF